jgi:hypothetical protein
VKCAYCGSSDGPFHRDHVVPRSRGGPDSSSNLVIACERCNSEKHDLTATEWLGSKCPANIMKIEVAINGKIAKSFAGRGPLGEPHRPQRQSKLYGEELVPLMKANRFFPVSTRTGKQIDGTCVWRYANKGVMARGRRIMLEFLQLPSGKFTSSEAVKRFISEINVMHGNEPPPPTPAQRRRRAELASRRLEALGI